MKYGNELIMILLSDIKQVLHNENERKGYV